MTVFKVCLKLSFFVKTPRVRSSPCGRPFDSAEDATRRVEGLARASLQALARAGVLFPPSSGRGRGAELGCYIRGGARVL